MRVFAAPAVSLLLAATPGQAQDRTPLNRPADQPIAVTAPAAAQGLTITGGAAVELSYDQYGKGTGGAFEPEGYVDVELNGFYVDLWATLGDEDYGSDEVDLAFGYRATLGSGIGYDLSYYRYYFPDDRASDYGELFAVLTLPVGDRLSIGTELAYDPDHDLGNGYLTGSYAATDTLSVSVKAGVYQSLDLPDETEWEVGATYALGDETSVDLRWYDGTDYTGYVALLLSFDTTLLTR